MALKLHALFASVVTGKVEIRLFVNRRSPLPTLLHHDALEPLSTQDDYEERRVRHEAAHFLSGYLCGLPIKSYKADGGTTLVEFYDSVEGDMAGRALKFTPEEVDQVPT